MPTFDPYGPARPCKKCEHWGSDIPNTNHAQCVRETPMIQADARRGCAFWTRAIGSDDEPDEHDAKD